MVVLLLYNTKASVCPRQLAGQSSVRAITGRTNTPLWRVQNKNEAASSLKFWHFLHFQNEAILDTHILTVVKVLNG